MVTTQDPPTRTYEVRGRDERGREVTEVVRIPATDALDRTHLTRISTVEDYEPWPE